ncbi:MAG: AMP-dependent synthetase [Actinobacteria bacterium RBG_16_64_13]|nr:MAG: AMP-dependent synthetase [Actinobacteria bacterium RBG_16_64_13]
MPIHIFPDTLHDLGLTPEAARAMADEIGRVSHDGVSAGELWSWVSRGVLSADVPFAVHRYLYGLIFKDWDLSQGPPPAWTPTDSETSESNIAAFSKRAGLASVHQLHRWSADNREAFWGEIVESLGIRFKENPTAVVDLSLGVESPRWLPGARLNIAESCFQAPGDAPAIVHQAEGGQIEITTYRELDRLSNRFARGLVASGLSRASSVAIVMPMTVEAVAAYLGVVKAGYAVSSIADSFAPDEIATRLRISAAGAAVTQDVMMRAGKTLPMYQKVVDAGVARAIVVPSETAGGVTLREQDVTWDDFLADDDTFDPVACGPDDLTSIMFSSGTTGDPKAIPWTHTTPLKCAMDGHLHQDIKAGEVVAWPTSIGWMMGSWLIYASLLNRATMALFYGAPVTREFCEFVQNARVAMLGVIPSMVKAWQNADVMRGLDWSSIKLFSSTGECSNADDYLYLMSLAGYRPIIEYCGGTEIGGGYVSGTVVRPASPATFSSPSFGLDFYLLDERGEPARSGEVFVVPPSIGLSNTLLNKDHHQVYYEGTPPGPKGESLRRHGDEIEELPGGYYRGHGRADDTMNLGGIKVSSTEIERTLATVHGVIETAAVAVDPPGGGPSQLVVYVVPTTQVDVDVESLKKEMQRAIAAKLNPLFKIQDVVLASVLPRTASNKVMRRVLRDEYGKLGSAG